jgi:hypothetical protein
VTQQPDKSADADDEPGERMFGQAAIGVIDDKILPPQAKTHKTVRDETKDDSRNRPIVGEICEERLDK